MKKMVLVSGGLDSGVCLAKSVDEEGADNVTALNAFYGQRHRKEIDCARKLCDYYGVQLLEMDLSQVMQYSDCSLLTSSGKVIAHGDYAEQTEKANGKPVETYVPFRNGVLLSVATAVAISIGASSVVIGAHKDDSVGAAYPDCSPEFIVSERNAIWEGSGKQVILEAPFIHNNKAAIVEEGLRLNVPFEITWSCYEGGEKPCGECGTCIDRQKAFEANGVIDPLL